MSVTSRGANIAGQFDDTDLLDELFTHNEACFPAKAEENTAMSNSKKPTWSASGEVDAPPKEVWKALVCFLEQSGLGKVTVDEVERRVSLQGEWWYRGEYIVKDHNGGSLIHYRVYNIAPGTTRWLVPLVAPSHEKLREQFQGLLRTLGQTLRSGGATAPTKIHPNNALLGS